MALIKKIKKLFYEISRIKSDNSETRLLLGAVLAKNVSSLKSFQEAEFKVFSQFGDDGIIQFLLNKLTFSNDKFIEFGVENYEEANTRFLLMHNNWQGLVIDGSQTNITYIKNDPIYWRHDLTAVYSFITVENINQILADNGFAGKVGILSIDIDGNDYWVWKAITVVDADVVIVEYNSIFGSERAITIPYKSDFSCMSAHYSGLYFGASLSALCELGNEKGYSLIGCNQAGNNAYFLKNSLLEGFQPMSPEEGFVKSRFRQARSQSGKLTFAGEVNRIKEITGLPVVNTRTSLIEAI
ncbi:hypothetical protein [Spirosoma endbachense]|uniref:Uncharacterized protein n=1 Tax=Spirosoma endbachense TaxID=2666025 RepID=A0A6P1W9B5_9BACT|nr:hypothetical protein [Spirosoma endbachense]QHW00501.1 hypothetical protein GJR95_38195 [Spirosoma endbachense]